MRFWENGVSNMNQKNLPISAIVVAKNEEERIAACLKALSFCTETIVVDNGSTDKTATIAATFGAKVIGNLSGDFSQLHNVGVKEAKYDWVLYVDADEIVTDELKESIINKPDGGKSGYFLQRKNYYLGKPWPGIEKILRFMRRDALVQWEGELHETAIVKGAIGDLSGYLIHDTHRTLEEMVVKTNRWSEVEAKLRFVSGHPKVVPWRLFRVFLTGFSHTYFWQGGWKVGAVGLIESLYQGFSLFITYAKLWEMQQKKQ